MKHHDLRAWIPALLPAVLNFTLAGTAGASEGKLVIEAGRIVTLSGPDIEDGRIVIEGGRITAIGKADEVQKPWDAVVIGGPKLVAFPGFVEAHTSQGMDRQNENVDVAPFLDIRDSIDPVAYFFEDCLYYLPMESEPLLGRLHPREVIDLRTGKFVAHRYGGEPLDLHRFECVWRYPRPLPDFVQDPAMDGATR